MNLNALVGLATARQADDYRRCKVVPVVATKYRGGGRAGSVLCTLETFSVKFGVPHDHCPMDQWYKYDHDFCDGKISAEWYIRTPRGLATVHDYWWNPKGILSVAAACGHDRRSVLWAIRWLRLHGLHATFETDNQILKEQLASA